MTEPTKVTELRATAEQIEEACPERLKQIGKEITERLKKADKQTELAQNHLIAVEQLLAEAKSLCDDGGFDKFRELVCPQLGKSQAYALLAIATAKKTLAEHRTEERERKRRTRAKQKAAANSGTVPEEFEPAAEANGASEVIATDLDSTGQTERGEAKEEASSVRRAPSVKDVALTEFNNHVARLVQMAKKSQERRFIKTPIKPDDLRKLGTFVLKIADLKSKPHSAPQGTGLLSATETAEERAVNEALDAECV